MKKNSTQPRAGRAVPATLLAAALRAQSEGVFIAERSARGGRLKIIFANDSFCSLVGRGPRSLVGQPYEMLHASNADVAEQREWLPRARPGQPLVGEGFLVRADGGTISAAWSLDPLFNKKGRLTHVVATYRDQTEKRRLHEALVHSQRLDAVGRLAGGVAHDFNNLISVINGYCEMLAAHVAANPQALREVSEIHNAGRKAAALTQQLLAFSRRQPFDARVVNFNTLVNENAEILRRFLGTTGRLELDLAGDLANVRTDPAQFQQVLLNLVLNARDALRSNGHIVVHTENRDIRPTQNRRTIDVPPGRYVALSVMDNGTGMDTETQKHLFEPFFTTKPEGKGTGLGLALVYGVVQQSGGHIYVRSAPLMGSTFEILLPATDEPAADLPPPVSPLPSVRGSENVLLIEDDEVVRKMVAGILTADGYSVVAAKSYAAGLRDLPRGRPVQLLIAPLDGDDEKAARRLRDTHPPLRVLCTSMAPCDAKPRPWIPADRMACIQKPFALSELVRAARKLLDAP
jgi:PAS domain S-box-containing protein